jgi:Zinc carboxypeptidase
MRTGALLAAIAIPIFGYPLAAQRGDDLLDADGSISFDHFHTWQEVNLIMERLSLRYPELTELESIGRSYEGVELLVMTITNEATGPASEKPAFYLDGGIHAAELTGSEVALYTLGYLLEHSKNDAQVRALLDTRSFYIRPKFNPDGSNLVLNTDQSLRSTVHPVDEDFDGISDEDPGEDLDGDGWITRMRQVSNSGPMCAQPEDPRILVRRQDTPPGATCYDVFPEGIDNDSDGRFSEDGIGGIDMNRNFPRNWERWHLQPGSGDYPLSEPETAATVRFINDHRNIAFIVHGHTSGGFVFRLPSASPPSLFDTTDLALIDDLSAFYSETTGRPIIPSATHPTNHRYGTLISFGYWDHGVVGWVPEYSPGPEKWVPDANGDGEVTESDWHAYNDSAFDGSYFSPWTKFDHPELGEVEIGGWHRKFWGQNPPAELLLAEVEQQVPWFLHLAGRTPLVRVAEPVIQELGNDRYRVSVTVRNDGDLATHLTQRGYEGRRTDDGRLVQQVIAPPVVTLQHRGGTIVSGGDGPLPASRMTIDHLAGANGTTTAVTARDVTVTWVVESTGPFAVRATVVSQKGGTHRSAWVRKR